MSRKQLGVALAVLGVVLVAGAFFAQAQLNSSNAVSGLLGRRSSGSPLPWVLGVGGAVALVGGLILALVQPGPARISAGWHDDPDDPTRLRYHDGTSWTEKTAAKS